MSGGATRFAARHAAAVVRQRVRRLGFAVEVARNRAPALAHQGLQRSGTNYLARLLSDSGVFVCNRVDPLRDDPRHKHFRWQEDKDTIVMSKEYVNETHAASIDELNSICGWPAGRRHVVLVKDPHAWLPSIHRWGVIHGWVGAGEDFWDDGGAAGSWLREWDAYYGAWIRRSHEAPDRVRMVAYETLQADPVGTVSALAAFVGAPELGLPHDGRIAKVAHSATRGTAGRGTEPPAVVVRDLVASHVHCDWTAHG